MQLITTVEEMRAAARAARAGGRAIGLVPTMGALHQGHLSLIEAAAKENDWVVASIFVNPTQFAPTEDLAAYPRDLDRDLLKAEKGGARVVFAPSPEEIYPGGEGVWVEVTGRLTGILCGRSRPAHFRGVTTVVARLFNIVGPDRAYFGQKDGQQAQVIRRMVRDLFMPVDIRICPLVRESDGLALSSRNSYLSPEERRAALALSRSLTAAGGLVSRGERRQSVLLGRIREIIAAEPLLVLDYAEIHRFPALSEVPEVLAGTCMIALAVKVGTTRLIDNQVLEIPV